MTLVPSWTKGVGSVDLDLNTGKREGERHRARSQLTGFAWLLRASGIAAKCFRVSRVKGLAGESEMIFCSSPAATVTRLNSLFRMHFPGALTPKSNDQIPKTERQFCGDGVTHFPLHCNTPKSIITRDSNTTKDSDITIDTNISTHSPVASHSDTFTGRQSFRLKEKGARRSTRPHHTTPHASTTLHPGTPIQALRLKLPQINKGAA